MTGLLDGMRVLELSLWQPGHTCTQLLADLGADVLKVEPPGGDRMRNQEGRFATYNAHKRSVVLDLKSVADRRRLFELVADAEVVVDTYRPGLADRLGIGFEALRSVNPAIVVCSISGFGQTGPLSHVSGHDHNYQAYAGSFTFPADGSAPQPAALLVGDQGSGLVAAFAILAAVMCARRTGEGESIDVSITDLLAAWVLPAGAIDTRYASDVTTIGLPAMGVFRTGDGRWVELGVYSENHLWDALCDGLGLRQHIGLDMGARSDGVEQLRAELAAALATRDRDELVETLGAALVPIAPILTRDEMLEHPHFTERGILTESPDGMRSVGHPVRYRVHSSLPPGRAPALDQHRGGGFPASPRQGDRFSP
jgi:crotonobetainyl-CoA:carnitine CoA-transferase CaiB-like acyl-CoA transferase